jgi:hypothetical protein
VVVFQPATYQSQDAGTSRPALPETVSVAVAELTGELREGLLALAVGAALRVLAALMEEDVTAVCGPKGHHDPERTATRHGSGPGSGDPGRAPGAGDRPRIRATDGTGELPVPTYELFSSTEVLGRLAMERMLAGLSTRRYPVGLEPTAFARPLSGTRTATSSDSAARPPELGPAARPHRVGPAPRRTSTCSVLIHLDGRGTRVLLVHPLPGPAAGSAAEWAADLTGPISGATSGPAGQRR